MSITLSETIYIKTILSKCKIQQISLSISVRDIDSVQKSSRFVLAIIYINNIVNNNISNISTTAVITRYIYLIDKLKIKILIDQDIITFEKIFLDFEYQELRIESCRVFCATINIKTRKNFSIKIAIRSCSRTTILLFQTIEILIVIKLLLLDRNFLFKSIY